VIASVGILAGVAAGMAVVTAFLILSAVEARDRVRSWVALFLLAMMGEMWISVVIYFASPSERTLVLALAVSGVLMIASVIPLFVALARLRNASPTAGSVGGAQGLSGFGIALLAALVLANEFLMSWGIQMALGGALPSGASSVFVAVVDSPWFLFTMAAEMALSSVLLWNRLPRPVVAILLLQSVIMLFSPPALGGATWLAASIYVSSGAMIVLFIFLFEYLYRHRQFTAALSNYLLALVGVYGLMMAGLFVWMYFGDASAFAISIVLEMVVFYVAIARPERFSGTLAKPWQLRSHWAFGLLSFVFVAELCMGAVLSLQLDPADYVGAFPFLPLSGPIGTVLLDAVSNGFWFLATAAASSWFLIMMGLEMGTLVVFKLRETKNLENRIRLGLTMGSYAAFAAFYPSIYFGMLFPNAPDPSTVPVLGWSMGIGSYPLAIGVFGVLLVTYAVTGVLVAFFGRRVVCSVFCTAPLMYQGTAIDSMKSFNRSSQIGHKYLGSRFSAAYSITTGVVMAALFGTALLSYFDTTGATNIYIQGTDPSVFFFILSFSVGWYVLFVSIPYVGNYNCVTMGYCYTGTITQAIQKISFFKLKVRDPQVCRDCTTLDCAKGCPVGLVDMPGHFRTKGEFRSTKCCGVGDCVEDCPYDNLYISDVRHWFRRRLGLPETRARRSGGATPAPRARVTAAPVATTPLLDEGAVMLPMVSSSTIRARR
jgi:ferredoxin